MWEGGESLTWLFKRVQNEQLRLMQSEKSVRCTVIQKTHKD